MNHDFMVGFLVAASILFLSVAAVWAYSKYDRRKQKELDQANFDYRNLSRDYNDLSLELAKQQKAYELLRRLASDNINSTLAWFENNKPLFIEEQRNAVIEKLYEFLDVLGGARSAPVGYLEDQREEN